MIFDVSYQLWLVLFNYHQLCLKRKYSTIYDIVLMLFCQLIYFVFVIYNYIYYIVVWVLLYLINNFLIIHISYIFIGTIDISWLFIFINVSLIFSMYWRCSWKFLCTNPNHIWWSLVPISWPNQPFSKKIFSSSFEVWHGK